MTDLRLIWDLSGNTPLLFGLSNLFHVINPRLSYDETFHLARNFEEYLRQLIVGQDNIVSIDNNLYFVGELTDFQVRFTMKLGSENLFPHLFFETQPLLELTDSKLIELYSQDLFTTTKKLLKSTFHHNLGIKITSETTETWDRTELILSSHPEGIIDQNFEKLPLGMFFYLLYLERLFRDDPNVCVVVSPFAPLAKKLLQLEADVGTLDAIEFMKKNPSFGSSYPDLKEKYRTKRTHIFRLELLNLILLTTGPYVVSIDKRHEVDTKISNTFKRLMDNCTKSKARYTLAFVVIQQAPDAHANILIIDNQERIIERFDPNGATKYEGDSLEKALSALDNELDRFARSIGYFFATPEVYCPTIGIQAVEMAFTKKTGYCVSWSILYAEERVQSHESRTWISNNLLKEIVHKYDLIRPTDEETAAAVENWMNERIKTIFMDLREHFTELSEAIGIQVQYNPQGLAYVRS